MNCFHSTLRPRLIQVRMSTMPLVWLAFAASGCSHASLPLRSRVAPIGHRHHHVATTSSADPTAPDKLPAWNTSSPLDAVTPPGEPWYDATPLLRALRPEIRKRLPRKAGLSRVEDLPLYDLTVSVDPSVGTFDVDETLFYRYRERGTLSTIRLRIEANEGTGPKLVTLVQGTCAHRRCTVRQPNNSQVVIHLDQPMKRGEVVRARMKFTGLLRKAHDEQVGMMAQAMAARRLLVGNKGNEPIEQDPSYGLMSTWRGQASLSGFFAILEHRRNGRWVDSDGGGVGDHGSDDLANVRTRWLVPIDSRVMCPGWTVERLMVRRPGAGNKAEAWLRVEVAAPLVRDFAGFVGGAMLQRRAEVGDVVVRTAVMSRNEDSAERLLDVATHALNIFEDRFGPYPYRRLDVVEAPLTGGAGGMEFSGMVAIAHMLTSEGRDTQGLEQLIESAEDEGSSGFSSLRDSFDMALEFTVAHEVAHQWWHGLVGSDSRLAPFVDEGLAQFSTLLYFEDRYGKARARRAADAMVKSGYVSMRMMGGRDGPVQRPANTFTPLTYAGLVYGKGPYFYLRLREALGDAAFFAALRDYVDNHWFRMAPNDGPLPEFEAVRKATVSRLARRWLREAHGDEDLGPIDYRNMLGGMLGLQDGSSILESLLQGRGNHDAVKDGTQPSKTDKGTAPMTPQQVQQLLHQMDEMIDGI